MQAQAVRSNSDRMSFAEFVEREKVSRYLRAGFRVHVGQEGTYDYRTETEWQAIYRRFARQTRARRS